MKSIDLSIQCFGALNNNQSVQKIDIALGSSNSKLETNKIVQKLWPLNLQLQRKLMSNLFYQDRDGTDIKI